MRDSDTGSGHRSGVYHHTMAFRSAFSQLSFLGILAVLATTVAGAGDVALENTPAEQVDSTLPESQPLISASSGDHLWFIADPHIGDRNGDRPRIRHHSADMTGPHYGRTPSISQKPEALAASGSRVWLAFAPQEVSGELRREVFTIRASRDPNMGMYDTQPRDRLGLVEALPGTGRLAGFAAGADGPFALLVPLQHELVQVRRNTDTQAREQAVPRLYHMRGSRWHEQALPEDFSLERADQLIQMTFDGPNQQRLNIFISHRDDPARSVLHQRDADGRWSMLAVDLDLRHVRSLTSVNGRLAGVLVQPGSAEAQLGYIRQGRMLNVAAFAIPAGAWAVQGMTADFRMIVQRPDGELMMQVISALQGDVGEALVMREQPLPTAKLWHTGLMMAVSVLAVLIVLMVRPGARATVKLPERTGILPALPRFIALVIDLVPGGVLAVLIMGVAPAELLRLPITTETLDQSAAHLIMIAITISHCTITELFGGTTLGKMLLGAGVVSATGDRARGGQILFRNFVKLMILLVPPLAIFALLNPYMQGFNDMAARTVVLRELDEAVEEEQGQ